MMDTFACDPLLGIAIASLTGASILTFGFSEIVLALDSTAEMVLLRGMSDIALSLEMAGEMEREGVSPDAVLVLRTAFIRLSA